MIVLFIVFTFFLILIVNKILNLKKIRNKNLLKFKNKFLSQESNIEKIFCRDDEKTSSDPYININIGMYDNEDTINRKSNIHRARLSKFKRSKLNGENIFVDQDKKIFKYVKVKKKYI